MLYTCVRNLLDKRFGQIPKKRGLPMASQGQSAPNWHNCTVPAQGFAQRPCLRFHVRQANPNSNLCAQCAHGPPNNIGMQVPCDPRTVCQTPKTRGCPMIRARPAKVNSNLGAQCARGPAKRHCNASALCSTQGLPNPKETQGPMIHARSTKQRCDAGAAESNIMRQRVWPTKTRCNSCRNNCYQIAFQSVCKCCPRQILKLKNESLQHTKIDTL